jgi:DNA-binding transcriptional regulator YhcF (GntR family)
MRQTDLTRQLTAQIATYIHSENAPKGTRLVERALAERLRVSRSPARSALRLLEAKGIVGIAETGGYVVLRSDRDASAMPVEAATDEDFYLRIARDRLEGHLPDKVTENFLMRRYACTQSDALTVQMEVSCVLTMTCTWLWRSALARLLDIQSGCRLHCIPMLTFGESFLPDRILPHCW